MKVGLIIILTLVGLFIFGPLGALGGLLIGCFAGVSDRKVTIDADELAAALKKAEERGAGRKL